MTQPLAAYAPGQKVHQFELAGLGPAPYVLISAEYRTYQACPGAPVQPGGSCDYCGTGIMWQFTLRAADGRVFKVGSDCVLKTDSDKALRVAVKTEVQQRQAEQRKARAAVKFAADSARVAALAARLPEVADIFSAQPHPYPSFTDKTRLDWAEWMLKNAGMSGRLTVARAIEAAL